LDSEFRRIVSHLEQTRLPRRAGETLTAWLERIDQPTAPPLDRAALREIVALHYAHWFEPNGLDTPQRATLQRQVQAWLDAEALPSGKANARVTAR